MFFPYDETLTMCMLRWIRCSRSAINMVLALLLVARA